VPVKRSDSDVLHGLLVVAALKQYLPPRGAIAPFPEKSWALPLSGTLNTLYLQVGSAIEEPFAA